MHYMYRELYIYQFKCLTLTPQQVVLESKSSIKKITCAHHQKSLHVISVILDTCTLPELLYGKMLSGYYQHARISMPGMQYGMSLYVINNSGGSNVTLLV